MNVPLQKIEFTIIDQIVMNPRWSNAHHNFEDVRDGILVVLDPPYEAADHELTGKLAMATTPSQETKELRYDFWKINDSGCIALFFEGASTVSIPRGTTIRFKEAEQDADAIS
jgi:hypothetical protein